MRRFLVMGVLAALVAGGCVTQERYVQIETGRLLRCPADEVKVSDYQRGLPGISPTTWQADGCDRRQYCSVAGGGDNAYRMRCLDLERANAFPPVIGWN